MSQTKIKAPRYSEIWRSFHNIIKYIKHAIRTWKVLTNSVTAAWAKFKGTLLGPRKFLETESPLKMMENAFYFTLKALFVLKTFMFLFWVFGCV